MRKNRSTKRKAKKVVDIADLVSTMNDIHDSLK